MPQITGHRLVAYWLAAIVSGPHEGWKRLVNRVRGVRDISPQMAQALVQHKGALVLDVREQNEFDAGHVANSRLIPLGTLNARIAGLEEFRDRPIVVICHGGKRSATACWQLARLGFSQTFNIAGGMLAWKKARLPIEK